MAAFSHMGASCIQRKIENPCSYRQSERQGLSTSSNYFQGESLPPPSSASKVQVHKLSLQPPRGHKGNTLPSLKKKLGQQ